MEMIDLLNVYRKVEGDFQWGLAYHSYAQDLTNPCTWNDPNATCSMNTQFVTFKNLEVLNKWALDKENKYKGNFCAYIAYNENVAHNIYAGCDALLVPSRFEPCGLTQLISMRYGAVPIVRETGGLKDTVQPYNAFENTGNGFTFDRYESGLLYDAINRAKTLYFENRVYWDDMVVRDMNKDVSWEQSAKQYKDMYVELTPRY